MLSALKNNNFTEKDEYEHIPKATIKILSKVLITADFNSDAMTEFKMADFDKCVMKISAVLGRHISMYASSSSEKDSISQYRINTHTSRPVKF